MLFPSNKTPINFEGLFKKKERILALNLPCLLSNSMASLLADKNAISVPEKNAEQTSVDIMIIQL